MFQDKIKLWFFKPKLEISYDSKEPYKRFPVMIDSYGWNAFDRFKIKNIGSEIAKGCRCQIYSIKDNKGKDMDLQGFPVGWASRPDFVERLDVGPGESEFVDLVHMCSKDTTKIFFNSYHNVSIGMNNYIPINDYIIKFIISGNNFKPYFVSFKVYEKLELNGFKIKLLDIKRKE